MGEWGDGEGARRESEGKGLKMRASNGNSSSSSSSFLMRVKGEEIMRKDNGGCAATAPPAIHAAMGGGWSL